MTAGGRSYPLRPEDDRDFGAVIEQVAEGLYSKWPLWTRMRYRFAQIRLFFALIWKGVA